MEEIIMSREFEQPITIERRESERKYSLTLAEVKEKAKEGVVIPIYLILPADLDTPFAVYLKAREKRGGKEGEDNRFVPSMLLESVVGGESVERYSYICVDPRKSIRVTANEISISNRDGTVLIQSGKKIDPLKAIQEEVSKTVIKTPGVPPFSGGYVGYLGYEVSSAFEPKIPKSNPDILGVPEAMLFDFDTVIAIDRARNEMKIVGNIDVGKDLGRLDDQYKEVTSRINAIADRMKIPITVKAKTSEPGVPADIQSNFGKEEYMDEIRKIKEYVEAGDLMQVVFSRRLKIKTEASPLDIYSALRSINPSPFMVYFEFGDFQIIGASPELLVKIENKKVSTWPIAGTRGRRLDSLEEDEKLAKDLLANEKERAEHIMLVDLGRNDVGRVARPGTVKVAKLMEVVRYSNVMHMASEVEGMLRDECTSLDALRACFPAGTVTGAPKIEAQKKIDEHENQQRGPYAGTYGYISYDGELEHAIAIRTIVVVDGVAYVQVGGGIVYDSEPAAEYQETIDKAQGSVRAIRFAEGKL